ncbi:MAG: DUF421 domain-containing protein [Fibrobacteres bacterium]|nr:DUF421 domain-containing protein [Fibrobacterota bacterium]
MEQILRTFAIYGFLMVVFRFSGKRTLKDITVFDFILLLVLSEGVQQALTSNDYSTMNAWVIIATFVSLDIGMSLLKRSFPWLDRVMDGEPLIIVRDGVALEKRMAKERIGMDDVLEAARQNGLESLSQIKYAVLERNGAISIIRA